MLQALTAYLCLLTARWVCPREYLYAANHKMCIFRPCWKSNANSRVLPYANTPSGMYAETATRNSTVWNIQLRSEWLMFPVTTKYYVERYMRISCNHRFYWEGLNKYTSLICSLNIERKTHYLFHTAQWRTSKAKVKSSPQQVMETYRCVSCEARKLCA